MVQTDIAFFLPHLMGGGAEKVLSILASGLAERGLQVDFVLVKAHGVYLNTLSPKVHVVNLNASNTYFSFPGLISYLRKNRPAVFLSSLNLTNLIALLAVRVSGTKTRSWIRIANTISYQKRSPWKQRLERVLIAWMYPWADAIIAVSRSVAQDMARYATVPDSKIHVVYNPVFDANATEIGATTHRWLENPNCPVILGIGRLTEQKDFKTLINAFAILRKKQDAHLIILGEGELRRELEILAENLGVRQDLDLPGYVEDPRRYLQRSNVFVLSSAWEGLPNVLIEALSSNCPIVSTDCPGGVLEILADGKYGALVPVGDAAAMADAVQRTLEGHSPVVDPEWLEQFSFDRIIDQVITLLRRQNHTERLPPDVI